MKDKNLNPVSLIITAVALVLLVGGLVWAAHHQSRFVPTPPPAAAIVAPSDIPSGLPTQAGDIEQDSENQNNTNNSVCYSSSDGSTNLEITTTDGQNATGSLSQNGSSGALSGTLAGSSDGSTVIFNGQYVDALSVGNGTTETISLTQSQATVGSSTLSRVNCTQ